MRITSLTLTNFGVYAGENRFDFATDKPVVLIGGMNGRGKTTFLEAVLVALYGANSFAYVESNVATFGQYLKAKTNVGDGSLRAAVSIEFEVCRLGKTERLTVRREWDASKKRVFSKMSVLNDGVPDRFLADNWDIYVEQLLPRALSSFFFFDGEKIAELSLDGEDAQIRESMRAILGVSVVDVLRRDLSTVMRRVVDRDRGSESLDDIEDAGLRVELAHAELKNLDTKMDELENAELALQKAMERLQSDLYAAGGDAIAQRAMHGERLSMLRSLYKETTSEAIALASDVAPLAMFEGWFPELCSQAKAARETWAISSAITRLEELAGVWSDNEQEREVTIRFINRARADVLDDAGDGKVAQLAGCLDSIASLQEEAIPRAREAFEALESKRDSLAKQIESEEAYLSLEVDEREVEEIRAAMEEVSGKLAGVRREAAATAEERSKKNGAFIRESAAYKRRMSAYLASVDSSEVAGRALRYIGLADSIFEEFAFRIQEKKTDSLAREIAFCFQQLSSKRDLVQDVKVDPRSLKVTLIGSDGGAIERELLSAGERQLLVIATLWALAKCSMSELPVIIDTPLARLDSAHRMAIVESYFPNAADQVIILSTDSEITGDYYEALRPNVSSEYTLVYDEETHSTSVKRGYFEEAHGGC